MLTNAFNPKKTGLFWRLERLGGGGGGHDGPPIENLHNGSVRCNLQDRIFRFSKIFFILFYII